MNFFPILRVVAMLRRIARGIERANELAEDRMRLEFPQWSRAKRYAATYGKPTGKAVEFGTMDVEELNRRWLETHPEDS